MKTRSGWFLAAGALVAGAVLILAWRNLREAGRTGALRTTIATATRESDAAVALFEARRAGAEKRALLLAEERDALARRTTGSGTAAASASKPAAKRPRSLSIAHLIRDEPDAQVLYLESQRAALRATYGPLFRQLGLSPEQAHAFQNNLMARNEKMMDLDNLTQEDVADLAAINELRTNAAAEYQAAQRTLLGPEQAGRWQEYERTSAMRTMVSTIAGATVVEGVPISTQQAEQVVQILAQASPDFQRGGGANLTGVDWATIEPLLRGVLSAPQLEVFRTVDPGPTAGGFPQTALYAAVNRANAADKAAKCAEPARPGSKK